MATTISSNLDQI